MTTLDPGAAAVAAPVTGLEQLVTSVREPDVDKALASGGAGKERSV